MIACTLPALTDSIPERKREELTGEVTRVVRYLSFFTRELQVVGNAASIAIRTWVRNNDKTKARAEEREKNIGARIGDRLRREIGRGRRPRVGDG